MNERHSNRPLRIHSALRFALSLHALMASAGCAASAELEGSEPGLATSADSQGDVRVLGAELQGSCEGREQELRDFAFWASNETIEALTKYEDDPDNELAVRYFGRNYDHAVVKSRLQRLSQLGRSERLEFACLAEDEGDCPKEMRPVFYTSSTEWQRTDGWRINVCGDRFWDEDLVSGTDSGHDASQVGVMVHELSHLTGAFSDGNSGDEEAIVDAVSDDLGSAFSPATADCYRFYVMKTHF